MYRDDLAATHARLETLQRDLDTANSEQIKDKQRIAQLSAQLASTQEALQRMGGMMPQQQYPRWIFPSRAGTVLTLGILSLVVCSAIGPIAWAMGNEEMRRMDMGQTPADQRGTVVAGRVCGIIGSCLLMFAGLMMLFVMATIH